MHAAIIIVRSTYSKVLYYLKEAQITYVFIEGALSTPSTSDRVEVAFIVEVVL